MTYFDIIKQIELFASGHTQINSFYAGQMTNFQASASNIYPALIVLPVDSTIDWGKNSITFNIITADLLENDRSNLNKAWSDMLEIQKDFYSYFHWWIDNNDESYMMNTVNLTPFDEQFDDFLVGWISTINIQFTFPANYCQTPLVSNPHNGQPPDNGTILGMIR